eukprot:snap_masked-scaffold_3-processed-gene-2.33-mRNA-1 protein AED:1.00 eAED:1.00 QI:0/-1/0/0/-1/1/1/0/362
MSSFLRLPEQRLKFKFSYYQEEKSLKVGITKTKSVLGLLTKKPKSFGGKRIVKSLILQIPFWSAEEEIKLQITEILTNFDSVLDITIEHVQFRETTLGIVRTLVTVCRNLENIIFPYFRVSDISSINLVKSLVHVIESNKTIKLCLFTGNTILSEAWEQQSSTIYLIKQLQKIFGDTNFPTLDVRLFPVLSKRYWMIEESPFFPLQCVHLCFGLLGVKEFMSFVYKEKSALKRIRNMSVSFGTREDLTSKSIVLFPGVLDSFKNMQNFSLKYDIPLYMSRSSISLLYYTFYHVCKKVNLCRFDIWQPDDDDDELCETHAHLLDEFPQIFYGKFMVVEKLIYPKKIEFGRNRDEHWIFTSWKN